ncbi:hypothetical protein BS47DRAFT_1432932 [Hydnum rufescens UP504]|uniref:Uncharacterized protein n=1 Tax=Hydnum rufescens UP504 TaxID=1448309 RepID=A0A9P6DLC8_9AGAM|nr:hypothetical protein BS47DRAFT_1432932 [Hydnum rufescens UP504]
MHSICKSYQERRVRLTGRHEAQSSAYNDTTVSPTTTASTVPLLGSDCDTTSSATSHTPDPHAVSNAEAQWYYSGLPSKPKLLYRTGKEQWSPPRGPWAHGRLKELCEVFAHPITKVWSDDLAWKIRFTTIDVVRFKEVGVNEVPEDEETAEAKKPVTGPVTIWIGVFPESTSATAAHDAAQDILVLLRDYEITDVDIDYRESYYTREAGPRLLRSVDDVDPLVNVISPLTSALGLSISTKATPNAEGMMALYLAEGGDSNKLLGLSCRHVLIGPQEANLDYIYHASGPSKDVLLLGNGAFTDLVNSIKIEIGGYGTKVPHWREQIEVFVEREKGTDIFDVEKARAARIKTQGFLDEAENAVQALRALLDQIKKDWKTLNNRVLGRVLYSPAISLGVSEHRFTEDWGIFEVDRAKLSEGFQGNKLDLGTKLTSAKFTDKCFPRGDANWKFEYPYDRLLPLIGVITDELMHTPDMWDFDGEPCLLVVKSGHAADTTLGRANGIFSIVREYFTDMSVNQTSMEWAIINYDSQSDVFSAPGDSGSIIADIRGRIGGMLTAGSGKTETSDMTYATPFWWILQRIRANKYPNVHLNVLA